MSDTSVRLHPEKFELLLTYLQHARPALASVLTQNKVLTARVKDFGPRSAVYIDRLFPDNDLRSAEFDRSAEASPDDQMFILDGPLELLLTATVQQGRTAFHPQQPQDIGRRCHLDAAMLRARGRDVGKHGESRDVEVTVVERMDYLIRLRFDDGHELVCDYDELRTSPWLWVDAEC
jgi:DUF971 family protein